MKPTWKLLFILQLLLGNSILLYCQGVEEYIEHTRQDILKIEKKIDLGSIQVKKLIFKCEDDPYDGNVTYYHTQNKIEKISIEYYYEGTYQSITYYLKEGELLFQEILANMEMGEYDVLTGRGETTERELTRIYIESSGHNSKRCIVTETAEELLLKEHVNCENFDEAYYEQVIGFFRLEVNSKVCLIYD
jgi:hypothetical protein